MYLALSIVYTLVCAFLIFVVLLQQGRGGGMGSAFGGGSNTVFGGSGAGNVLTRITTVCATLFMLLSSILAYMSSSRDNIDELNVEDAAPAVPAVTEAPAAAAEGAAQAAPSAGENEGSEVEVDSTQTEQPSAAVPSATAPTEATPTDVEPTDGVDPMPISEPVEAPSN